jgi:hypothetical protein
MSQDKTQDRYPTLRQFGEHVPCDGSCGGQCGGEGYTRTLYACQICAELIVPGVTEGERHWSEPGMRRWSVRARIPWGTTATDTVSLRLVSGDGTEQFGVARVGDVNGMTGGPLTVHFDGIGVLGRRGQR